MDDERVLVRSVRIADMAAITSEHKDVAGQHDHMLHLERIEREDVDCRL